MQQPHAPGSVVQEPPARADIVRGLADGVFRLTLGFIALVIFTFVALEGWRAWRDYDEAFAKADDSVINLAQAMAQTAEDAILQVDVLTASLRERIEGDGLDHLDVPRIHALMAEQIRLTPQLHGLFLYGPDGRWIVTDKSAAPPPTSNADRDYFIYHQTHADRRLHVGRVVKSRSTGDLIIPISRRLNNADGSFAGVLLGTVTVSFFVDYYDDFKLDDQGAMVLALRTGEILARFPFTPGITEQSIAQGEIYRHYLPLAASGVVQAQDSGDGVERIYGYRALSRYPLIVEAGTSRESVLGPWQHDVLKTGIFLLVLIACLVGVSLILLGQLCKRKLAEHEVRQAHQAMMEMALTDSLTGLGNRRRLDRVLADEIELARHQGYAIALIMVDIDDFKRFNDAYGHAAGDDCLRLIATTLRQHLSKPRALALRYGGEEFAILLPDTSSLEAGLIADDLLSAIRALGIKHRDHPLGRVTASAGVASSLPKSDEVTADGMVKAADDFLSMAKHSGRNRWHSAIGNSELEALLESRKPA